MELSDKIRLIIGAVVLLIIVGAAVAFFARPTKKPTSQTNVEATQTQQLPSPPITATPTPTPTPSVVVPGQEQGGTSGGVTTKGGLPISSQSQANSDGATTAQSTGNTNDSGILTATTVSPPTGYGIIMQQQQQQQQSVQVSTSCSSSESSSGSLSQSQSMGDMTQQQSF